MKGTKTTKKESKKGRGQWQTEGETSELIQVPGEMLDLLKKTVAAMKPLAYVEWGMEQLVQLERLDPGRKYENIRFSCAVRMPAPAKPSKAIEMLGLVQGLVEDEIQAKVAELEEALGAD